MAKASVQPREITKNVKTEPKTSPSLGKEKIKEEKESSEITLETNEKMSIDDDIGDEVTKNFGYDYAHFLKTRFCIFLVILIHSEFDLFSVSEYLKSV